MLPSCAEPRPPVQLLQRELDVMGLHVSAGHVHNVQDATNQEWPGLRGGGVSTFLAEQLWIQLLIGYLVFGVTHPREQCTGMCVLVGCLCVTTVTSGGFEGTKTARVLSPFNDERARAKFEQMHMLGKLITDVYQISHCVLSKRVII